ncbi:MAG: serine hydrolase domain-containing protein [Henriciella sp.]
MVTLDAEMKTLVDTRKVANVSYGLWQNGDLKAEGYYGSVSSENCETVSDTTIYRIYSMTKPITAIGMLILMERGAFELDDPITKILPEFAETEVLADYDEDGNLYTYRPPAPPTMRQLLSHTAGFAYGNQANSVIDRRLIEMEIMRSRTSSDLISKVASLPYARAPGAEWQYSIASDLQGAIIERVAGESLDAFLTREIFDPLGMRDTGFYVAHDQLDRISGVTEYAPGNLTYIDYEAADFASQAQYFFEGGKGLYSTQADYSRFLTFLIKDGQVGGRQLLQPETLKKFRTNKIQYRGKASTVSRSGQSAGLGFGFGVGTIENSAVSKLAAPKSSYYWRGALGTWFWVDPENDLFFIGMVQSRSGFEDDLLQESMRIIYGPPAVSDAHDPA